MKVPAIVFHLFIYLHRVNTHMLTLFADYFREAKVEISASLGLPLPVQTGAL